MEKYLFGILVTLLTVIACTPTLAPKIETTMNPLEYKMTEALSMWSEIEKKNPSYDAATSWLDEGVRRRYAKAKKILALRLIEQSVKQKVFTKGPHNEDLNFKANNEFGHYNPKFVQNTFTVLTKALKNPAFKKLAGRAYENHFKSVARNYYHAYQFTQSDVKVRDLLKGKSKRTNITIAEVRTNYIDLLNNKELQEIIFPGDYIQETFRPYADNAQTKGLNWYEAITAPGFWVRRSIDGTDKEFFKILDLVVTTFDKDWK